MIEYHLSLFDVDGEFMGTVQVNPPFPKSMEYVGIEFVLNENTFNYHEVAF